MLESLREVALGRGAEAPHKEKTLEKPSVSSSIPPTYPLQTSSRILESLLISQSPRAVSSQNDATLPSFTTQIKKSPYTYPVSPQTTPYPGSLLSLLSEHTSIPSPGWGGPSSLARSLAPFGALTTPSRPRAAGLDLWLHSWPKEPERSQPPSPAPRCERSQLPSSSTPLILTCHGQREQPRRRIPG